MWNKTIYQNRPQTCGPRHFRATRESVEQDIPANIQKNENEIVIELALASYEKSEITIKLESQDLIVSTSPSENSDSYNRQEFKKSILKRVFRLPNNVDKDLIEAKFENGILKLTLPKTQIEKSSINIL